MSVSHRTLSAVSLASLVALVACGGSSTSTTDSGTPHDAATADTSHPKADAGSTHDAGHDARGDSGRDAPQAIDASAEAEAGPVGEAGGPTEAGKAPKPTGDASASSTATLFAIHHLWLGDSLPDPTFSPDTAGTAWASFGYNIDGLLTTQASTDVCTLDNSFGKNIVPFLASALPNLSQQISSAITAGSFNVLIGTVGLTSSPTQTNTGLKGSIFNGASYGGPPPVNDAGYFKPTDEWPIFSGSLHGSLEAGAIEAFPTAYVTDGVWVNGSPGDITLELLLQGQPLVLQIHEALVSFTHTVDASGQDHATNGFISGVLKTSELLAQINVVAAEQDYCAEASLLLNFIAASSDILHDGTNVKGQVCDGVSIGLAFDADGVAPSTKVVESVDAAVPKGCVPDAG